MERLDFSDESKYSAIEASIHLNRYLSAKKFIKGKKVLDVACGEGYGTYLLKKWGAAKVTGVDISKEALFVARDKFVDKGIKFIEHNVEELPFEDNSFDVVVSYETIEHLDNPEKFLMEIKRVIRGDGIIIVSCPNDPYYYKNDSTDNPFHKRKYTWFDFQKLAIKYLGRNVSWYFGFATNGYMTIPESECKVPERDNLEELSMMEMLKEKYMEYSSYVLPDRYVNHWNANYYLGVWGYKNSQSVDTVVSFPREIFVEPDDPIFANIEKWNKKHRSELNNLQTKIDEQVQQLEVAENSNKCLQEKYDQSCAEFEQKNKVLREEYNNSRNELEQKYKSLQEAYNQIATELEQCKTMLEDQRIKYVDLLEENRVVRIQEQRTSSLLEVANKEKGYLWNRISQYEAKEKKFDEQINQINLMKQENDKIICEKDNVINGLQGVVNEYDRYKRSISYKLMQPVRKTWDVLRFWKKH